METLDEKLPKAIDLSHHLSELAKARQTSPLKGLARYWGRPGLISLAGGMPSPAYFPLASLSAETLVQDSFASTPPSRESSSAGNALSWIWRLFGNPLAQEKKERTEHISIPKYAEAPGDIALETALQYGTAQGLVPLQEFMREFTTKVYQPHYSNFITLVHAGNTDGFYKVVNTFCNRGDVFLTEEWTYPSALASSKPFGVLPVAVAIDGVGMRSDSLRKVLAGWDESARGVKRPHMMYTVPVGQNPTGATMGAQRKKEIYDICVEYDIIIVEDDPYYFLQEGSYCPKHQRAYTQPAQGADEEAAFLAQLAPSYLKFDYQGRVVRLDSFSKTIAPGSRLGWFTCNEVFAERLERQGETSTQAPCGFGQSVITQLLTKQWGYKGYIRWLRGLRTEYTIRRDHFVDLLSEEFDLQPVFVTQGPWSGLTAYVARAKDPTSSTSASEKYHPASKTDLFSFVPPTSGMFIWLKVHFENHPSYVPDDETSPEDKLWTQLAENNLLVAPGRMFAATDDVRNDAIGHMRIAFSHADFDTLKEGVHILRRVLTEFFAV